MRCPSSRWPLILGFLVGACSMYVFLHQVWFERSSPVLTEAQEKGLKVEPTPVTWRRDGPALINVLQLHQAGQGVLTTSILCI